MLRYTVYNAYAASRRRHDATCLSGTGSNVLIFVPMRYSSSLSEKPIRETDDTTETPASRPAAAAPRSTFIEEWRSTMTSLDGSQRRELRGVKAAAPPPTPSSLPINKTITTASNSERRENEPMSNLFEKRIQSHMTQRLQNQAQQQQQQHQPQHQPPPRQATSLWRERLQKNTGPSDESGGIPLFSTITTTTASSAASMEALNRGSSPSSSTTLWRRTLSATSSLSSANTNRPQVAPISDMKDVSLLRAAFLKCANRNDQQVQQQKRLTPETNNQFQPPSTSAPWRTQPNAFGNPNDDPQGVKSLNFRQQGAMAASSRSREHRVARQKYFYDKEVANEAWNAQRDMQRETQQRLAKAKPFDSAVETKGKDRRKAWSGRERDADDTQVTLPATPVSVAALSGIFRIKISRIMQKLRECGEKPTDDEYIVDIDTMEIVALDLGLAPVRSNRRVVTSVSDENRDLLMQRRGDEDAEDVTKSEAHASLPLRPPVVCLMGHVDHGKTTLMDALRRKNSPTGDGVGEKKKKKKAKNKSDQSGKKVSDDVAGTEAGGITQVISAFQVALANQDSSNGAVTFLDTPGHAAFRAMRESGSHAADVIVLVVAADDGVSKQTIEILDFYKSIYKESAGISLVVAMTKIDKPGINVDESRYRIENELMEQGILTESFASTGAGEYGPAVQLVPVSGVSGDGLDDLIDALVLQSEVMELRADHNTQAEGIVLDARIEKGIGVVADCIIRWGSMECGDVVLSGVHTGKVRALKDVTGANMTKVLPSQPVRIIGFKTLPKAGDPIVCVESEEKAEQLIERRAALGMPDPGARTADEGPSTLEVMGVNAQHRKLQMIYDKYNMDQNAVATTIRIPVLLKADADGTLAALREAIVAIGNESSLDIVIDPIGLGIGTVTTSDVSMAKDSNAAIFSFNVKQNDKEAISFLESEGVVWKSSNVIYTILDAAKEVFAKYLPPTSVEHVHGKAVVQAVFEITKNKARERIAGLKVTNGNLFLEKASVMGTPLNCHYRVVRNGELVSGEGEVVTAASLRKVKEDVQEVRNGDECGLGLSGFEDFQNGDVIECYSMESKSEFV